MTLPVLDDVIECSCDVCVRACEHKPGWFAPGEAEKAAELLGLSLQQFFNRYLLADYWVADQDIYVLSPAIVGSLAGGVFPFAPYGRCVFLGEDKKCMIHQAKPFECRGTDHRWLPFMGTLHKAVADSWVEHQQQVQDLLWR